MEIITKTKRAERALKGVKNLRVLRSARFLYLPWGLRVYPFLDPFGKDPNRNKAQAEMKADSLSKQPGNPGKETGMLLSGLNYIFIGLGIAIMQLIAELQRGYMMSGANMAGHGGKRWDLNA